MNGMEPSRTARDIVQALRDDGYTDLQIADTAGLPIRAIWDVMRLKTVPVSTTGRLWKAGPVMHKAWRFQTGQLR